MIDLIRLLRYRFGPVRLTRAQRAEFETWLLSLGWAPMSRPVNLASRWIAPVGHDDWSTGGALRLSAEAESARALRALGWFAPHEFGKTSIGHLCRAPGTWEAFGIGGCRGVRGSGGRWLSLARAMKLEGLRYWVAPPDRVTPYAPGA